MTSNTGSPSARPDLYTTGGTIHDDDPAYVERAADRQLFDLCRAGELAYILSSRQMGKSSLIVRTASKLGADDVQIRSAIVDLQSIPVNSTDEQWYLGILQPLYEQLGLDDPFAWWQAHPQLGFSQRFAQFLRDVMLQDVTEPVVLFFDEIDSVLSLKPTHGQKFTDDFFTTIRGLYNARAHMPELRRLSFVLAGVATPGDLIEEATRTPFNIGQRVELGDFTVEEARPLADGL